MQDEHTADLFRRERPALVIIITGPSGVGKDSLVKRMVERGFAFHFVVTATDRAPRRDEVHGQDYFFYTTAEFERMIERGEFLEHARVYDQYKGIPRSQARQALDSGQDVVMRVDVQGAQTVKSLIPAAVTVFLTCDSEAELIARLRERRTESEEAFLRRLSTARHEMTLIPEFDYVIANDHCQLDCAVDDVAAIVRAEHCRTARPRIEL